MRWLLPFLLSAAAFGQSQSCANLSLGVNGNLNGFTPYPASDAWNTPVSTLPADATNTPTFMSWFGPGHLHPDFGSTFGIPYNVIDTTTKATVPITMTTYPGDSDIMPWPLDSTVAIEGAPGECPDMSQDYHAIIIDKKTCFVYETWQTAHCNGGWTASNGNIWDLTQSEKRPYGMTSADAAGLSIFGGLLRYEEASSGTINHAIRFTVSQTRNDANGGYFVAPATHAAGASWSSPAIIGMRLRLKSSFDISGYSKINQTILTAMKTYGMIIADNGGTGYFQGTQDTRWNDDDLNALKAVAMTDFEIVNTGAPVYDATTAPTGPSPTINAFTASQTSVAAGTPVLLSYSVVNDSYDYIDVVGPVRGPVTVTPAATTTYTLVSTNQYGRTTRQVTVTVGGSSSSSSSTTSGSSNSGSTGGSSGSASTTGSTSGSSSTTSSASGSTSSTGQTSSTGTTSGSTTSTSSASTGSGSSTSTTSGAGGTSSTVAVTSSGSTNSQVSSGSSSTSGSGGAGTSTGAAGNSTTTTSGTTVSVPDIVVPSTTTNIVFQLVITVNSGS